MSLKNWIWDLWVEKSDKHFDENFIKSLETYTPTQQELELELRNCKIFDQQTLRRTPHLCQSGECKHFRDDFWLCIGAEFEHFADIEKLV